GVLECSAIRSVRPAGGLRRQGRLHNKALLWMLRLSWTKTMVLALAKWISASSFKTCVIHRGVAICDLDVAPAFERSKHHEEIGGAIALVLVMKRAGRPALPLLGCCFWQAA